MNFFVDLIGEQGAVKMVLHWPSILSFSLERRFKPRYIDAVRNNLRMDVQLIYRMATNTEVKWSASMLRDLEEV